MSKKTALIVLGILILITGAVVYAISMPKSGTIIKEVTKNEQPAQPPAAQPQAPGVYTAYTKDAVATATGTKLLFFYAPWCPQCRSLDASIVSGGVPSGVTVFKVDYDTNQKLRQQYGVTLQTTFVKIDASGNKIASYVAYDEPQFSAVARELLK